MVVYRFACFQDEGLDVLVLRMYKCKVIKVAVTSIEGSYLIFDRVGAAYVGEFGTRFKPTVSIHIPI